MVHARAIVPGLPVLQSSQPLHRGVSKRGASGRAHKRPATGHPTAQAPTTKASTIVSAAASCHPNDLGGVIAPAAAMASEACASGPASRSTEAVGCAPDWGPRRVVALDIEYIVLQPRSGEGRMYQLPGEVAVVDISGRVLYHSYCHPGAAVPPPPSPPIITNSI